MHTSTRSPLAIHESASGCKLLPEVTESSKHELRALLGVFDCIISDQDLSHLLQNVSSRLHPFVNFDAVYISLYDADKAVMRVTLADIASATAIVPGLEIPIHRSPAGKCWETQRRLVINSSAEPAAVRFPEAVRVMREQDLRFVSVFPLTTSHRRLGALAFGRRQDVPYTDSELWLLEKAASELAMAVNNALSCQQVAACEQQLHDVRDHVRVLSEITSFLTAGALELPDLFLAVSNTLRQITKHEYASLLLLDPETHRLRIHAIDCPGGDRLTHSLLPCPREGSIAEAVLSSGRPMLIDRIAPGEFLLHGQQAFRKEELRSVCCLPLLNRGSKIGVFVIGSVLEGAFRVEHTDLLRQVANQLALAVDNVQALAQITELESKLSEDVSYTDDPSTEFSFDGIVGKSERFRDVLRQVETVGSTDATVLVLGETGTGKELIVRALHRLSHRSDRPLVKVNCAAIPSGLLESELFGHEKGAFTGAISQRIGRFELANHGTLFLDEVGDIPLDLQAKLLRALQESEFERLGSTRTIHVDVRIVAATNRDLEQLVREGRFRSDLYYRLRVFPINLPPLRDRGEDIPLLVRYFTQKYARSMGRKVREIPERAMDALMNWSWPGNIRELENFIERAVILSPGPVLNVPVEELRLPTSTTVEDTHPHAATLAATEREYILQVLKQTNGVISGPHGAAACLGVKRTTLQARMRKLGISGLSRGNSCITLNVSQTRTPSELMRPRSTQLPVA